MAPAGNRRGFRRFRRRSPSCSGPASSVTAPKATALHATSHERAQTRCEQVLLTTLRNYMKNNTNLHHPLRDRSGAFIQRQLCGRIQTWPLKSISAATGSKPSIAASSLKVRCVHEEVVDALWPLQTNLQPICLARAVPASSSSPVQRTGLRLVEAGQDPA